MEEMNKTTALREIKSDKVPIVRNDKLVIFLMIFFIILAATGIFGYYYYSTNMVVVVKYDGGEVTNSEYTIYYKMFADMLSYYGYSADTIPEEIARKAARDEILYQKAKEAGVTYSEDDKKQIEEVFADETKTSSYLEKGIDLDKLKTLYYMDATINQYLKKLQADVPEADMLAYLKKTYGDNVNLTEYVTKQILFQTYDPNQQTMVSEEDKAKIKTKAEGVLARALAGEDFTTLVNEFSDDTGTKANGGEYKMYEDSRTVEAYANAVKSLEAGKITPQLVESDYGFHIILLVSINPTGRTNSENERSTYIDGKITEIIDGLNVKIEDAALTAVVEEITGVKANQNNTVVNNTVTENTTTTTNTVIENTTTTNTAQ